MSTAHRLVLPGTEWLVRRSAVLRTAGFPADGLDRFTAPDCARAADDWLAGRVSAERFGRTFDRTVARCAAGIYDLAADPAFREAVVWQSRPVLAALDGIVAAGPSPVRHRKHRERERVVARYWQRCCAEPETSGFSGPVCRVTVDPDSPAITVKPGAGLLRDRRVFLEDRALAAVAAGRLLPSAGQEPLAEGLVRRRPDPPDAEQVLRGRVAAIGDPEVRERALADLDRIAVARDAVARAAGDPDALVGAFDRLAVVFAEVTGGTGQLSAGRGICRQETTRDLDVTVGGDVLAVLGEPLAVLLRAARWVTARMVRVYSAALRDAYRELCAGSGRVDVPLSRLWFPARALFHGPGPRPADTVAAELADRWAELFALAGRPRGTTTVTVPVAEAAALAGRLFVADRPGWSAARPHSMDLRLCATDPDAINRGEFTAVLDGLHVAPATDTCGASESAPPVADPGRLVPVGAFVVRPDGDELVAVAPDGRHWPLAEVFDRPLAELSAEACRLPTGGAHTPRLCIDRLVVARRTWRTTVGACPLAAAVGDRERYLAARRWRAELGLPERVSLEITGQTESTYADLTSPLFVSSLATTLRSARQTGGPDMPLTVTEALPDTDGCWLPDTAGRRYVSGLRLHLVDPMTEPAATTSTGGDS